MVFVQTGTGKWMIAVVAIVTLAGVTPASAESILLDLGNDVSYRGASVTNPDPNGNYWNSVWSGEFYPDILDLNGNPTEIDFGFSSATGTDSFNGPAGTSTDPADSVYDAEALGNLGVDEAVFDYYVSSTFQIQQLDPSLTYNLTFFGSHKYNDDNVTRYTVYTDATFSIPVASVELLVGVDDAHNEDTVVTISDLSPQADDILYVGFEGASGGLGYLNALEVEIVPEPASVLLVAGGCALACCLRRRNAG
jgi:hypothetical protein